MDIVLNNSKCLSNIDTVIWDKDGTIFDANLYWGKIITERAVKIIQNYNIDKSLYSQICKILGYDMNTKKLLPKGPIALVSREEVLQCLEKGLFDLGIDSKTDDNIKIFDCVHKEVAPYLLDFTEILPYVKDTIECFYKNGVNQILITSDTKENAYKSLEKFDLLKYFCGIYGKNDFDKPKKTGVPLIESLKLNNLHIETTICIGDSKMDAEMGKNAGVKTILTATGQTPITELLKLSEYSVNNLGEINLK